MHIIRPLIAVQLMMLCIFLIQVGYDWIDQMHGIYPLLAFLGAVISALCALIMLFIEDYEDSEGYRSE